MTSDQSGTIARDRLPNFQGSTVVEEEKLEPLAEAGRIAPSA
jgi:hypothetical protein